MKIWSASFPVGETSFNGSKLSFGLQGHADLKNAWMMAMGVFYEQQIAVS